MKYQQLAYAILTTCIAFLASLSAVKDASSADSPARSPGYIDVHLHFSNQVMKKHGQRGPQPGGQRGLDRRHPPRSQRSSFDMTRFSSGGSTDDFTASDYAGCADNMIELMDKYGIEKAVVMPQPRLSGQHGYYDFRKIAPAIAKYPDRLFLGGGGGKLNSMIHGTDPDRVTDGDRARFKKEALEIVESGAKVFGELAALHISLQPRHVFEEAAPDHPLFLLLADIAAEHNIPIDIHMEAIVKDTPTPSNLRKISTHNPSTLKANIPAFERLLKHNRKANIVWQHIGWDNAGQMTIELLSRMLDDHPNLYIGFKIEERPFQVGTREEMPNRMVDRKMNLKKDWILFFKDYSDRLLVASDQFVGIPGRTVSPPQYLEYTYGPMKQLPADVLRKVGRDNAARLYNL